MNPAAVDVAFNERLRSHEAAHCAGALLCNLNVDEVWVGDHNVTDLTWDSEGSAGCTRIAAPNTPDGHRLMAIAIMAAPLMDGEAGWPRPWPLPRADLTPDQWDFSEHVRAAGLDEHGYLELCAEAKATVEAPEFKRLHQSIVAALEDAPHSLDATQLKHLLKDALMEHKQLEATTIGTTEDQGTFTAIAAAYTIDRVNDQIVKGAFANTIERWRASGKQVPLHWNHDGAASSVIGTIDPATMQETDQGLQVSGRLDIHDSETAREAWRSMRNNSMSLSFGYMTTKSRKRADGVNELQEIDLFEISIVPSPANPDTHVIEMKSAGVASPETERIRAEYADLMLNVMGATSVPRTEVTKAPLDLKRLERELTPITVETFPC